VIQVSLDLTDKRTHQRELKGPTVCNQELKAEKAYIITSGPSRTETYEENSFEAISLIDWPLWRDPPPNKPAPDNDNSRV
jgi:predicted AAA+ superfamily ATPase